MTGRTSGGGKGRGGAGGRGGKGKRAGSGGAQKGRKGGGAGKSSKRGGVSAAPKKKKVKAPSGLNKSFRRLCMSNITDVALSDAAQRKVDNLGLQPGEIGKLATIFKMIDYDESGEIDGDEFMEFIDEKKTPFTTHVFKLVDEDGSGEVDMNEFISMMCLYCLYSKQEILRFTFDSFDEDNSGNIDEEEFMELAKGVNDASPMFPGNFQTALEEFDQNDDGLIDFEEFNELNRRYPLVLFPAFRLQDNMQKATLGQQGWVKIARRINKAKYIAEYMKMHGGEIPQEPFSKKLGRCFQAPIEVEMAQAYAQSGYDEEASTKKKKRKKG
jgi:Ca2+-binding EF-hand superfamily protein